MAVVSSPRRLVLFMSICVEEQWVSSFLVPEERIPELGFTPAKIDLWCNPHASDHSTDSDAQIKAMWSVLDKASEGEGACVIRGPKNEYNVPIPDGGVISRLCVSTYTLM
jgi:hypothetical protein